MVLWHGAFHMLMLDVHVAIAHVSSARAGDADTLITYTFFMPDDFPCGGFARAAIAAVLPSKT